MTSRVPSNSWPKMCYLLFLVAWAALVGALYGAASVEWEKPIMLLDMIITLVVIVQWTRLDAEDHAFELWRYFVPMLVVCPGPLIVLPVYFVKTRGWGKGIVAIACAIAFAACLAVIDYLVSLKVMQLVWGAAFN